MPSMGDSKEGLQHRRRSKAKCPLFHLRRRRVRRATPPHLSRILWSDPFEISCDFLRRRGTEEDDSLTNIRRTGESLNYFAALMYLQTLMASRASLGSFCRRLWMLANIAYHIRGQRNAEATDEDASLAFPHFLAGFDVKGNR